MTAPWRCQRCSVLCREIPRYDDRICLWCAREVAKFGGVYCGLCTRYHPGDDCAWEQRRLLRQGAVARLCLDNAPADVVAFFGRATKI